MIILSCCDLKYKKYMDVMVASVLKNTRHKVSVDYFNIQWKYPRNVDFLANYRIRMFEQNLYRGENMCWLDADSIVNKDISQIDRWLDEYDTCAVHTPEATDNDENRWLISVVGISNSFGGKWFLSQWRIEHDKIKDLRYPSIMTCQESYYHAIQLSAPRIKDVTYAYADKTMNPESFIFDGRGNRKDSSEWAAESARYVA